MQWRKTSERLHPHKRHLPGPEGTDSTRVFPQIQTSQVESRSGIGNEDFRETHKDLCKGMENNLERQH